ncbi:MAG: DUF177 domain-containing protein [Alphaproteobacteria bacterium]
MTENSEMAEFSHVVVPSQVSAAGSAFLLEPTADQRAALAERFDLVSLDAFRADLRLVPMPGGAAVLRMTGTIKARLVQRCVATLAPVEADIEASVDIMLRPVDSLTGEIDYNEDVEPYQDDKLDIGEIAAEELALALDPYPRATGAGEPGDGGRAEGTPAAGPFAALAPLRGKK